jgi:methylaspartate ammonia-lyase
MTYIKRVLAVPAVGAGYCEDSAALQAEYVALPQRFTAAPATPGFRAVRQVAEAISVGLVLDDGRVAWGDCMGVSYSATAGRDPVFRTEDGLATIQKWVVPALEGLELTSFRELAASVDTLTDSVELERSVPRTRTARGEGVSRRALLTAPARALQVARGEEDSPTERVRVRRRLHTAIRYGVSQALLAAVALDQGVTMAEVIAKEWGLPPPSTSVPIHAQSGSERYYNTEKMLVRRIDSLPHALVDDIREQVGHDGSQMTRYIRWLTGRIRQLGGEEYRPTIHLDVYGALGQIYDSNLGRILGQIYAWETAAKPFPLRIESPIILETRQAQIEAMEKLCRYTRLRKMTVQLVADEWANTLEDILAFVDAGAAHMIHIKMPDLGSIHNSIEAVLACKVRGLGAFLGGSYAETEQSARVSVHVALATRPDILMAKPGMGVDEAVSLVQNETARALACVQVRSE